MFLQMLWEKKKMLVTSILLFTQSILSSANALSLDQSKNLPFGKELRTILSEESNTTSDWLYRNGFVDQKLWSFQIYINLESKMGNFLKNGFWIWLIDWMVFYNAFNIIQSYRGNSQQINIFIPLVSPVLGCQGSEVSCPRRLPWKNPEDPVRLKPGAVTLHPGCIEPWRSIIIPPVL